MARCATCPTRSPTRMRDFDEVWIFENPDKETTERWFHSHGCRRWLTIRRDTAADRVLEVVG